MLDFRCCYSAAVKEPGHNQVEASGNILKQFASIRFEETGLGMRLEETG